MLIRRTLGGGSSRCSAEVEADDRAGLAGADADLGEAEPLEDRQRAVEELGGGRGPDGGVQRVRLDSAGAVPAGQVDGTVEQDLGEPLSPLADPDDEAGDGPEPVLVGGDRGGRVADEARVVGAGRDGAPAGRDAGVVVDQDAGRDVRGHLRLQVAAPLLLGGRVEAGSLLPEPLAPAARRIAPRAEDRGEVVPAVGGRVLDGGHRAILADPSSPRQPIRPAARADSGTSVRARPATLRRRTMPGQARSRLLRGEEPSRPSTVLRPTGLRSLTDRAPRPRRSARPLGHSPDMDATLTLRDGRALAWHAWGVPDGVPVLRLQGTPGSRLSRYPRPELWERL